MTRENAAPDATLRLCRESRWIRCGGITSEDTSSSEIAMEMYCRRGEGENNLHVMA